MPCCDEPVEEIFIMSIRPKYASAIFRGSKKYELRRLIGAPAIPEGSVVAVYASGNVKSIVGEFRAGRVIQASPERVWAEARKPGTGVGEDAWNYIKGAKRAMAIEVVEPRLYPRPITLEEVRRIIPGWMPPMSYRRLEEGDPLLELVIKPLRRSLRERLRA
ncbi:DNA-binding protein [Stetteria hydrogenophila]